jgi:glycosyltransferase involved in cell wall biosynthesis
LLVLNDGSTDETENILKNTQKDKMGNTKNMGQTPTINKGWRMTKGEIITWLNSDDTYFAAASAKG